MLNYIAEWSEDHDISLLFEQFDISLVFGVLVSTYHDDLGTAHLLFRGFTLLLQIVNCREEFSLSNNVSLFPLGLLFGFYSLCILSVVVSC